MSGTPKIIVLTKGKPREIEMGQELTIGRGYSNLLRLEGEEISRVHAIIYRRNNDFILRDLDSKNGVFLNGSKISYAQLEPGDRVQVGKYKMVFNPPENFDADAFGKPPKNQEKNAVSAEPDKLEKTDASAGYSSSKLFSVRSSSGGPDEAEAPSRPDLDFREEVLICSKNEMTARLAEGGDRLKTKMADLQESFFQHLLKADESEKPYTEQVLLALLAALNADRGVVILKDKDTGSLTPAAMAAPNSDVAVNRVVLRSGFSEGKAMLCPRTDESGLFRENDTVRRDSISSLMSAPIGGAEPFGLLYVDRQGEPEEFEVAHFFVMWRICRLLEMHLSEEDLQAEAQDAS